MADHSPDYKALYLQAKERYKQIEERTRRSTFLEFQRHCHNLLSRPLRVATPSRSTIGSIPLPKGKLCPTRLSPWTDCVLQQQAIYDRVCTYLQCTDDSQAQLFHSVASLENIARLVLHQPISSERDVGFYERFAVEHHVHDIIRELCKIPAAREEFMLGDDVRFNTRSNALTETEAESDAYRPWADQFCFNRVDGRTDSFLLTLQHKPPHKFPVETLRTGLRPMELWEEMVKCNTVPTDPVEKLRYDAERLVSSAIVQTYHVLIEEGRADGILSNGLARVLLHVPYDDPTTLLYHFCDPNAEIDEVDLLNLLQPKTSMARVLCQCLRSFRSPTRNQEWRNSARAQLHLWEDSFDHDPSLIPEGELQKTPLHSQNTSSPEPAPSDNQPSSSPSTQRAARQCETANNQADQSRHRDAQFCTQRCLLGLQSGGTLDDSCPNVMLHRQSKGGYQHLITSKDLVRLLKAQLDENIDRCTPVGHCGAYGAPFKLTCAVYGYTVFGKGTASGLWKEVSREAEVYQILRKAQGSAVPVFLGKIDLAKIYFFHRGGAIRHMLVMGWGGERTASMERTPQISQEINESNKEIKALGIIHGDFGRENALWNEELGRALIIDFRLSTLKRRPKLQPSRVKKRRLRQPEIGDAKRPRGT